MFSPILLFFQITPLRRKLLIFGLFLAAYSHFLFTFFRKNVRYGWVNGNLKLPNPSHIPSILAIRFVINMLTKYIPWEFKCRHQAWIASVLLKKESIPYTVYVGFKKNEQGKIEGHAWTISQNIMVSGFCNPSEYIIQSQYIG